MNDMRFANEQAVIRKAEGYVNAKCFLKILRQNYRKLTPQQFKTLRGQAVNGDVDGATKGLEKILGRA